MATTSIDGKGSEHVDLEIEGTDCEVLSLESRDAVSDLFRYELEWVSSQDGPKPAELIGKEAGIVLRDGFGGTRPVRGIITEAQTRTFDEGRTLMKMVVRPPAYRLTVGRDNRVFLQQSVVDIVKDILARGGVDARWELVGSYEVREYTAQYRESDWIFISRLLEQEGIHYWFDHEGAESILVLSDQSSTAPDLHGGAHIAFETETGMQTDRETVYDMGCEVQFAPTAFNISSFDCQNPSLKVNGEHGTGQWEIYDAPGGGPTTSAVCAARAKIMAEASAAQRAGVTGASSSIRIVPGRVLEVTGHTASTLDGRYFVTESKLSIAQRRTGTGDNEARPPECFFDAVEIDVPYRPVADTPATKQAGLQSGVVVGPGGEEVHPDDKGQVRLQFHWDRVGTRDDKSGTWMRVDQRGTANSMLLPRMGWNVLTMNEEGSVDNPMIMSRIFDAEHPPPYTLPDNKTRVTYRTATTPADGTCNEIRYEDKAGQEEMFINATRDMNVLVKDTKTETVVSNMVRDVGIDHSLDVGQNMSEHVVGNQDIFVNGANSEHEDVGASRQQTIGVDEDDSIGGNRSITTGNNLTTDVTASRKLTVGLAQLDISLGEIKATSPLINYIVGGAQIKATAGTMSESVGSAPAFGPLKGPSIGGVLQTIGGAKIELTSKDRKITVGKWYYETVGGSMILNTSSTFDDLADTISSIKVGGAMVATAPKVIVEAEAEIVIKCGGSSITIDTGGITVAGSSINLSDSSLLQATGATVEHNC